MELYNGLIENTQTFDFTRALFIFLAYLIVDAMYAKYTLSVANYKPYTSATIGSLMHFVLAFGVLNYVNNYLYVLPLALGSWLGTYKMVSRESLKVSKN